MRLVRFTLQEYLSAHPDIVRRPRLTIAEVDMTYLNFQQVKAVSTDPFLASKTHPFYNIALSTGEPMRKGNSLTMRYQWHLG